MIQKKVAEIAVARGKTTRVDRQEHIEMLAFLTGVAKGPAQVGAQWLCVHGCAGQVHAAGKDVVVFAVLSLCLATAPPTDSSNSRDNLP